MITLTVNGLEGTSRARHEYNKYKEVIMRAQAISGPILAWLSREKHCSFSTNIQSYSLLFSPKMLLLLIQAYTFVKGECLSVRKKRKCMNQSYLHQLCIHRVVLLYKISFVVFENCE
jgi:hypothetical protein